MKAALRQQTENEQRVAEEYLSSLSDLNCNSKPLINMLTMLAEENIEYASVIVKVVEQHIAKVPPDFKLPILYLIDSIVKNVKSTYVQLFSQCIVNIFCGVFEKVNEKIRERMYALRQTWNEVFSAQKLYALDVKVKRIDANWPITAKQPQPSIHVNPNFLKTVSAAQAIPTDMEEILHAKTRELLELKKKKLELELEATKKHLEEQEKQLSKATESVIPPVDATVASAALVPVTRPPKMTQQIMPGMIPAGLLVPHPSAGIRPGMFQQFRNPRPQQTHIAPTALMNVPQTYPINNAVKTKVHPVTPSLLNSVRQRDPRLARQQHQQQQIHHPQSVRGAHINQQTTEDNRNEVSLGRPPAGTSHLKSQSKSNRTSGSTSSGIGPTFERKSPNSHTSSTRISGRSSGKSSSRERDRDNKTNESKNTCSPSTSTSTDRRKPGTVTNSKPKCDDKDAFEIAPLSSAFKRKSSSPASSPSKTKESKRLSKFRGMARSKNRSRSQSPELPSKDVDLRPQGSPDKRFKLSISSPSRKADTERERKSEEANTKDLEKNPKSKQKPIVDEILEKIPMLSSKDVDLRQLTSSSALTSINQAIVSSETSANVATSSPKVSFKIQKLFNKLEKSTENLSTVAAKDVAVAAKEEQSVNNASEDKTNGNGAIAQSKHKQEAMLVDGNESDDIDTKKRSLATLEEEEPLPKKSKQAVFDPLFGSQDVDLRTVMPPQILVVQNQSNSAVMTPPPPPVISDDQNIENAEVPEYSKEAKGPKKTVPQSSPLKKSSLDDVRAKLAKAAKYNKIGKPEKSSKEATQRLKMAELDANEDSQEANDEKIRTIISQAQELLDSKSINQEQYKNLVQTVMSINETKKLKEAKKRESLVASKNNPEDDEDIIDNERLAARDAVLKKKIPKLPKDPIATNANNSIDGHPNDSNAERSPIFQDTNSNDGNAVFKLKSAKEKRNKPSKWGERMDVQHAPDHPVSNTTDGNINQKHWHLGPMPTTFNKRPGSFNIRVPHPPLPPIPNLNLRLPQIALPSPWSIGANVGTAFPNPVPLLRSSVPPPPQPPAVGLPAIPAPPVIPKPCNSIDNPQADMVRSITIDGLAKEIRIYDKIAIVFMELDQPREIGFQAGQRSIIIDNMEPIALKFNDDFKKITIEDEMHKIRFGFPSRELYIDDDWYEIYFGGPPVTIPLKNKLHILKAEGPPPQVNIGPLRRDLVVGKINMIVDAHIVIPVFLDAKIQTFRLGEIDHTIQFADNLLTILLDGQVFHVEYGGLPKSITLGGVKYFIRFGALPQGVLPGKALIKGMAYINTEPPIHAVEAIAPPTIENDIQDTDIKPTSSESDNVKQEENKSASKLTTIPTIPPANQSIINIDELFQKLVSSGILGPTATLPAIKTDMDHKDRLIKTNNQISSASADSKPSIDENIREKINPIDLSKPETIKARQSAIVATLFSGMQCSSCGVRFPPEQTIKYSQHLDWHFRQNRRERDSTRKAHSRKWYYELSDWVQYEEIEDLEEREKNFFENQQTDLESIDDASNQRSSNSPVASCPAKPEDVDRTCDMCQEKFEQFYNEELEEWHLRSAVRVDDKIYHPLCYEDYKASLKPPTPEPIKEDSKENDEEVIIADDDNAVDIEIKIEENNKKDDKHSVTIVDDEDDDVIVLPNEEPSVTEIDDDDDEYIPVNVTREEMGTTEEVKSSDNIKEKDLNDTTESDVEIQEPNIPFTDLDTYEEKVLPEVDETSQLSLMNVKIKEEPKDDDDDDDDGFEDVGTVLIRADDEISIESSEGTQTHTIVSSTSAMSPCEGERPPSATSQHHETLDSVDDVNKSLDGTTNLDTEGDHNLSAAGPAPAMPVTSLVNKIKINITKNIISTNSVTATTTTTTTTSSLNSNELNSVSKNSTMKTSTTSTISTIPVLCGGVSSTAKTSLSVQSVNPKSSSTYKDNDGSSGISAISVIGSNMNVSNISVIGSSVYGSSSRYHHHSSRIQPHASAPLQQQTITAANVAPVKATEPLPPAEEVIEYDLKPALKKVALKKTKKVECGVETSGLCSIM